MQAICPELLETTQGTVKFIMNENAIIFFPASQQHRDIKTHGLSYEDDYRGNAVAGLVTADKVEIRFHQAFSDERIRALWAKVSAVSQVNRVKLRPLFYQGRVIG